MLRTKIFFRVKVTQPRNYGKILGVHAGNWLRTLWIIGVSLLCTTRQAICRGGESPSRNELPAQDTNQVLKFSLNYRNFRFDPSSDADLRNLKAEVDAAIKDESEEQEAQRGAAATEEDSGGLIVDSNRALRDKGYESGKNPRGLGASLPIAAQSSTRQRKKKTRRGLQEISGLSAAALACGNADEKREMIQELSEIVEALENSRRNPLPDHIDAAQSPSVFFKRVHSPVGRGHKPATNLEPAHDSSDDSKRDPASSSFWRRPENLGAENLYYGFGRSNLNALENKLCFYSAAKVSHGLNPGFEVECEGKTFKLKFAELSCEPFIARLFAALGFHADATDYAPGVKVRYDRRLFREFNSRQELKTRFTIFGVIPVYTLELQKHYDPFEYVASAVLRDGRTWSGMELKQHLLVEPQREHPEVDDHNFRPEVELLIDYLVTGPANVQEKNADSKSIGPWDFGQLDHAGRRELRGAGLLAAWVGWFDTRFDNTRLRVMKHQGHTQLEHFFSDLGGGLGQTDGLLYCRGDQPNVFPWTFTRAPLWQGPGRMAKPLRIEGFRPVAYTAAFAEMTIDDARWMARLIGQLTEAQLLQALTASGYSSAEVRLYVEKLVCRRDKMIQDLGLAGEIPLLRPDGVTREFSYDPEKDGEVTVEVPGSSTVTARKSPERIERGKVVNF